ncbi:unnamed protein product [Gemmata massiliana]|uniref:Uncharacterized protein n=1 Tax=Gemmata massiliana TaxID=1210884 RepID=A0A6P2CZN1_9BACT|nr:hypothetical protein [Gemmata massiliana]VTR93585.1 unnamed protein product [Gemmata massiliana]
MSTPGAEVPPQYLLKCGACDRTEPRTREEMLQHAREGWPRCCGDVMGYFALPAPSAGADTAIEKPALGKPDDTAIGRPALPPT